MQITIKLPAARKVQCLDALDFFKGLADSSVEAVVSDPPYGLSREPDIREVMQHWLADDRYIHKGKGFFDRAWDSFVPGPEYWKECYRVLKPGGHVLAMSSCRTWDLLSIALRFAGFENRDTIMHNYCIPVLAWCQGQGLPIKSHNISKGIDKYLNKQGKVIGQKEVDIGLQSGSFHAGRESNKVMQDVREPGSFEAKQWQGYGTALKPAWEVILVFRKPLDGTTIAENVLKHGTGGINIDGCRVQWESKAEYKKQRDRADAPRANLKGGRYVNSNPSDTLISDTTMNPAGRWPPNLVFTHHPDCKPVGTHMICGSQAENGYSEKDGHYSDQEIVTWECVEGCPVHQLNQQSGFSKTKRCENPSDCGGDTWGGTFQTNRGARGYTDSGYASRFFPCFTWDSEIDIPFMYCSKPTHKEKDAGLDGFEAMSQSAPGQKRTYNDRCGVCSKKFIGTNKCECPIGSRITDKTIFKKLNNHISVKPVALMRWLVKLVTPHGGLVMDPFAGTGTTGIACVYENFRFIGCDNDEHSVNIANARIAWAEQRYAEEIKKKQLQLL